jgi:TolB-like protein/DNA-binding winged helix-turn-helix (wHTH) protein
VPASPIQFDEFSLDCDRFELLRSGRRVKLEKIPMELLILLASKDGNLVTRQEIIERLWGKDVFLDTEHGINTAVRKIRLALKDGPEKPRFVQTVTGKGYRFVAELRNGAGHKLEAVQPATVELPPSGSSVREFQGATSARRWRVAGLAAAVVLLVAGIMLTLNLGGIRDRAASQRIGPIHSIAVLPLANLSADRSQDYYADGMTDELITALARNRSLRVVSRTSVMQYKGVNRPLREIAQSLGVDGVLEGSIIRSGSNVRINLQLVYAPTDTHVWAESYDRDLNDISSFQSEAAQTIARQVGSTMSNPSRPGKRISAEAHDAYLMGRYYWFADNYEKSQSYFQKAIDLQPDYAAAWSGLSDSYGARAIMGEARATDVMRQTEDAARKAVAMDDSLAEAHNSIAGYYYFLLWDWERAERESARTVELDPNYAEGHRLRGMVLETLNRTEESLEEQKKTMELDPFTRPWELAQALLHARRFDDALNEARARSEAQPDNAGLRAMLVDAYMQKGMEKEAAQEWGVSLQLAGNKEAAIEVHQAFERGGLRAVLDWKLTGLRERASQGEYVAPLELADVYACLKRKNEALQYLDRAYEEHDPQLVHLQTNPIYDFLHSDPHYQSVVSKMGLPAAQ